jgi:hypothetical protein
VRRAQWVLASLAVALLTAFASTGAASAATPLVLKEGGVVAAEGSPASGSLDLPCAHMLFAGTLAVNDEPTDKAVFTEGGGSNVCEGVIVRGVVKAVRVTNTGHFTVVTHLTYEVVTSGRCVYNIGKFSGTFTIPGPTSSTVSGTGKLAAKRSTPGCAEQIAIEEARAALSSGTTNEPYFAEK